MEQSINWALIAPILIVQLILLVLALVDWMKQENTRGPRLLWLFIILFVNILGPILYFLFGKKE
ncbi:MAG: PLD nuclease N-terminal domain-containing protein [Bacillales bacterium]|nr:PLDc_N domain-containing protein [Bacilli bacterium]